MQFCKAVFPFRGPDPLRGGFEVSGADLKCLDEGAELSDTIIDLGIRCSAVWASRLWQRSAFHSAVAMSAAHNQQPAMHHSAAER